MSDFVSRRSVVRRIWGDADTILVVFAGAAAEFALNRAADWLFFTGELPRDPIGRLFSTARFAQDIVFVDEATALRTLHRIRAIHEAVEERRGARIPDWAHRDVLYMLIDYSARAFELLHRPLAPAERDDLYGVFRRVGEGLGIPELPTTYADWCDDRADHLERDLAFSDYTSALYRRYRLHLGPWRHHILLQVQALLVPERVRRLLPAMREPWLHVTIPAYRAAARAGLRPLIRRLLLPPQYLAEVGDLDQPGHRRAG
jgi:uncharacterized protein (DUF2236 family)